MKKRMIFLSVVVFMAALNCRSADAWSLKGLKGQIDNVFDVVANAAYRATLAACEAEVADLEDQMDVELGIFGDESRRYYDLRRQMNDCQHDRENIFISLEECHEINGEALGVVEDSDSVEEGLQELQDGLQELEEEVALFHGPADDFVDDTCEKPKTDARRRECLSECNAMLEMQRQSLAWATYRAEHVEEAMQEDISSCQQQVAELEAELLKAKLTGCQTEDDDVGVAPSDDEGNEVCAVDAEGNEVCTISLTEEDDVCTEDAEGRVVCTVDPVDPSDGTGAD